MIIWPEYLKRDFWKLVSIFLLILMIVNNLVMRLAIQEWNYVYCFNKVYGGGLGKSNNTTTNQTIDIGEILDRVLK